MYWASKTAHNHVKLAKHIKKTKHTYKKRGLLLKTMSKQTKHLARPECARRAFVQLNWTNARRAHLGRAKSREDENGSTIKSWQNKNKKNTVHHREPTIDTPHQRSPPDESWTMNHARTKHYGDMRITQRKKREHMGHFQIVQNKT